MWQMDVSILEGERENQIRMSGVCMSGCVMKQENGFSLAELMLVVAVLAIMAAVSVPIVASTMRTMQLLADARHVASSLTVAKLKATSQMTRYQLVFDLDDNKWKTQRFNKASGQYEDDGAETTLSNGVSHSGITFQGESESAPTGFTEHSSGFIRFNSRGLPVDGDEGSSAVYLSDGDTHYAVTVSLAGKVQLWKNEEGQWTAH